MGGRGASIQIKKPNNIKPDSIKRIEEPQKPFASDAFKRLTVINSKVFLKIKQRTLNSFLVTQNGAQTSISSLIM